MGRRLVFGVLAFVFVPSLASAQLQITEIMYDLAAGSDSGREWVEVFNASSLPISLTDWKLYESGKNHKISIAGDAAVAPGSYAIIADNPVKFKADWPNFSGRVFDSAFSLNNEGETIGLRDKQLADIETASYTKAMGGNGSGDSLQRIGDGFQAGMPTPGGGVPASGLQRSPQKTRKSAKKEIPMPVESEIIGEVEKKITQAAGAAAAAPAASPRRAPWYWWLAPFVLASVGVSGIVLARHYRKSEWEIIEEIGETG